MVPKKIEVVQGKVDEWEIPESSIQKYIIQVICSANGEDAYSVANFINTSYIMPE